MDLVAPWPCSTGRLISGKTNNVTLEYSNNSSMTTHHDDFKLLQLFYFHEIMMNVQFCNQYWVLTEVNTSSEVRLDEDQHSNQSSANVLILVLNWIFSVGIELHRSIDTVGTAGLWRQSDVRTWTFTFASIHGRESSSVDVQVIEKIISSSSITAATWACLRSQSHQCIGVISSV